MQPKLHFNLEEKLFIFHGDYQSRQLPRQAGFRWHKDKCYWYTKDRWAAAKLRQYATGSAKDYLPAAPEAPRPWLEPLPAPPAGLALLPHQAEAVKFALSRKHSYLALDPGLGKTICAAMIAQALGYTPTYICPPFLLRNVEEEFRRWAPDILKYMILMPDTKIMQLPTGYLPSLLIVDEAHRYKNPKSKRSKDLFALVKRFERVVYLSGTPMPNRPMELYSILSHSAPECIDGMTQFQFGVRYCAGRKGYWGWDFSGASNLEELAERLKPFMLRMRKKDVLDLPPKIEETLVISKAMSKALAKTDRELQKQDVHTLMKRRIAKLEDDDELHVATYRRLLGAEKIKPAVEYIHALLSETDESILVFAYHQEVLKGLADGLAEYLPFVITGDVSHKKRHEEISEFQASTWRLVIANFMCSIGWNAFKASRILMVEWSWAPGDNEQAIDRSHRIGQKNTVFAQYMAFQNSLDMRVLNVAIKKSENAAKL